MEYEVMIDFGDGAIQAPHVCRTLSELGLYLERVPSMMGFEVTGIATVSIKNVFKSKYDYAYKNKETPAP